MSWNRQNFWQDGQRDYADPTGILRYYLDLQEKAAADTKVEISALADMLDPDSCPEKYLSYLARLVGVQLKEEDDPLAKRETIKSAFAWYRMKGTVRAFEILFDALGWNVVIYPLWVNPDNPEQHSRYQTAPNWVPQSMVEVEVDGESLQFLTPPIIQELFDRMEEVRPIHVQIAEISTGKTLVDEFPPVTDFSGSDLDLGIVDGWPWPVSTEGVFHGLNCYPPVRHDGVAIKKRDGAELDYDGTPYLHNEHQSYEGTCYFHNNARYLLHNGEINHDGSLDSQGRVHLHSLVDITLMHNSGGVGEIDFLSILAIWDQVDEIYTLIYHDGLISRRDGTYLRNNQENMLDSLEIELQSTGAIEDLFDIPVDESVGVFASDVEDRVGEFITHDGTIPDRAWHGPTHSFTSDAFRDGEFNHDGSLVHNETVNHDGTITARNLNTYLHSATVFEDQLQIDRYFQTVYFDTIYA